MAAMWLASAAPERVDRLALCCTSAYMGPPEPWLERAALVRPGRPAARSSAMSTLTPRSPAPQRSTPNSRGSSPATHGARSGPVPASTGEPRSVIALTALVAAGRTDELAMHVRAALRNGLNLDEI